MLSFLKNIFTAGLFIVSEAVHPQALQGISRNIVPPSPDAASFTKYGNIPVSNYTGVPEINISLYQVDLPSIKIPVSLSYHSSGIQVAEEAGWTGLGWNLQVGGMITREIRGQDDLRTVVRGGTSIPFATFSYQGYPFDPMIPTSTGTATDYISRVCRKEIDPEPDIFYYNFLGESGSFILPKQSQYISEIRGQTLNTTRIDIKFNKATKKWIVKTKEGTTLYFSIPEIQEVRRYQQPSIPGGSPCVNYFDENFALDNEGYYHNSEDINISAWYLEKIVTITGETITFIYDLFTPSSMAPNTLLSRYGSTTLTFTDVESRNFNIQIQGTGTGCVPCTETRIRDFTRTFTAHIYLKEIQFRNGKIEFQSSDRTDMRAANTQVLPFNGILKNSIGISTSKGPQKLDNLIIRDAQGNLLKKINFKYSYFNDNATNNTYTIKRLKLLSVSEVARDGTTALPPYEFTYNETLPLPVKHSRAVDFWGYYNGIQTNTSRVPKGSYTPTGSATIIIGDANRNPNKTYVTSGTIKEIKYPTGGRSVFEFEPHDYYYFGSGVFDLTENLPSGIPLNSDGIYAKSASGLRIKRIIDFDASNDTVGQKTYKYVSEDGTRSSGRLMLFPAFHTLEDMASITQHHVNGCSYFASTFSGKSSSYLPYANSAQGSIVGYDKVTVLENNKGVSNGYTAYYYDNQVESVGSQHSAFLGTIPNIRHSSNGNLLQKKVFTTSQKLVSEEVNSYAKQLSSQIPALAFRQTTEGITTRLDVSTIDLSCSFPQANEIFQIPTDRHVLTQKIVKTYSNIGNNVLTSISQYEHDTISHLQIRETRIITSKKDTIRESFTYSNNANWIPYNLTNEKYLYVPVAKIKRVNQNIVSNDRDYYTISPITGTATVNKVQSSTMNAPLETVLEIIKFDDYGNPITLKERNAVFTTYQWGYNKQYPIAKVSNAVDSNYYQTGYSGAAIQIGPSGHLYPNPVSTIFNHVRDGKMIISATNPIPSSASATINYSLTGPTSRNGYFYYNTSTGVPTVAQVEFSNMPAGTYTLTVGGSGSFSSYTFAAGVNVSFEGTGNTKDFFHENFEENNSPEVVSGQAHTGTKYWNGNTPYRPAFYGASGTFLIQWWALSAGKWSFKQSNFVNNMELTGPIDNVRIFPRNAEMSTYTYSPWVGMTSEIDPTGRVTMYKYDGFGRLELILDDKENVLKRIRYNYAGQVIDTN